MTRKPKPPDTHKPQPRLRRRAVQNQIPASDSDSDTKNRFKRAPHAHPQPAAPPLAAVAPAPSTRRSTSEPKEAPERSVFIPRRPWTRSQSAACKAAEAAAVLHSSHDRAAGVRRVVAPTDSGGGGGKMTASGQPTEKEGRGGATQRAAGVRRVVAPTDSGGGGGKMTASGQPTEKEGRGGTQRSAGFRRVVAPTDSGGGGGKMTASGQPTEKEARGGTQGRAARLPLVSAAPATQLSHSDRNTTTHTRRSASAHVVGKVKIPSCFMASAKESPPRPSRARTRAPVAKLAQISVADTNPAGQGKEKEKVATNAEKKTAGVEVVESVEQQDEADRSVIFVCEMNPKSTRNPSTRREGGRGGSRVSALASILAPVIGSTLRQKHVTFSLLVNRVAEEAREQQERMARSSRRRSSSVSSMGVQATVPLPCRLLFPRPPTPTRTRRLTPGRRGFDAPGERRAGAGWTTGAATEEEEEREREGQPLLARRTHVSRRLFQDDK